MLDFSIRIEGAKDVRGRLHKFSPDALKALKQAADKRADETIFRFKSELAAAYTSPWATGRVARGVTKQTFISENGVDVKFLINNYPELAYLTSLAEGAHFSVFPVGPYVITPKRAKYLKIPTFLRGDIGRFKGSVSGRRGYTFRKMVLHPGFPRDVIAEVGSEEAALFVDDMQREVEGAIVRMTS